MTATANATINKRLQNADIIPVLLANKSGIYLKFRCRRRK